MTAEEPTCAVCGLSIDPAGDHVRVDVEHVRRADRNGLDDYYLHERCASAVFDGWRPPA